ncbi:tripartite tricarboxylate transporter substrate binding protein [Bradyrhizobium sp. LHD-71]|uniref:Bug family tripartite tricarboxylate transporter substrate binding protein n=1 Tax=Bradyrhizobium sp. LHD-71 TaxID=3072141 RepID=UPI00281015EE|nr:tripartite tricarboxylate transporter substrate binding protein [Bradyrhizobium sp. LHD-71]MDQ8732096.1 tripartite tricarboxylate transporter substrate binding protein [Bradyrhizobium sp. LHD-71]
MKFLIGRNFKFTALVAALLLAGVLPSWAQAYPSRPIHLIVGFAAGGSNDIVARIVGQKAGELLGTTIVIENRAGANGATASAAVARGTPDGYTLILGSASQFAISPHTQPDMGIDPLKDFVPIGTVAMAPEVLAVNPNVSARSLAELVALAKSKELSLASSGAGGLPHLSIELFRKLGGEVNILHVPYRGGAPAATDTAAGHVHGIIMDLPVLQPLIVDGKLRAIAVTNKVRSGSLPDVPTSVEQGMTGLVSVNWFAVMAPAGTSEDIADRVQRAFTSAAKSPDIVAKLAATGIEPMTQESRAEFVKFLRDENARWGEIARNAGFTR